MRIGFWGVPCYSYSRIYPNPILIIKAPILGVGRSVRAAFNTVKLSSSVPQVPQNFGDLVGVVLQSRAEFLGHSSFEVKIKGERLPEGVRQLSLQQQQRLLLSSLAALTATTSLALLPKKVRDGDKHCQLRPAT